MGPKKRTVWRSAAKRALDLSASLVALLCLLPLLAVVAVLIRCETRGSVLFRQERLGMGGRPFPMWKLRTLLEGSGRLSHDRLSEDDPRVTSVGRFLRPWGIDELPQLWNVLLGQMSLVGPRPAPVYHLRHYTPSQRRRLTVKPGFTGWALIHGRNAIPWRERIELDIWYVENWSLWLDLKILVRSVSTLLSRRGTYGPGGVNDTFGLPDA
jgi:lipopolysaccharide/colanic/teichoic acid biosynthesis glycosyltransferase